MLNNYDLGTEVRWEDNGIVGSGIIEQVFRHSGTINVLGIPIPVRIADDHPAYLVRHPSGERLILDHTEVKSN